MGRKKVNLAYITDDAVRRATLKKRRKGLIKKVSELSTLCDVPACIVIYDPSEAQPVVWPSEPKAREILARFRALPELKQSKKMMNREGFLQQRVQTKVDQLRKNERENRELEMRVLLSEIICGRGLPDVGFVDAIDLLYYIDMRLKALYEVIENFKGKMMAETEAAGKEITAIGATPTTTEAMVARQNWFPKMPMPTEQQIGFDSNGGGGGLRDIVQPYIHNGSPWIYGLNPFGF